MKREEQILENTWNLALIYQTDEKLIEDLNSANKFVEILTLQKGKLFITKMAFIKNIKTIFEYEYLIEKAYTYTHHLLDQNIQMSIPMFYV